MNTTTSFIFYAIVLSAVLIASDVLYLRVRKKNFNKGKLPSSFVRMTIDRIKHWIDENIKAKLPKLQLQIFPHPSTEKKNNMPSVVEQTSLEPENESLIPLSQTADTERKTIPVEKTVHVQITADIPEGTVVHVTLQAVNGQGRVQIRHETLGIQRSQANIQAGVLSRAASLDQFFQKLRTTFKKAGGWEPPKIQQSLFISAIIIYLLAVSIGVDRFPIYFFTDEAVHANLAQSFWNNGLEDSDGEFLPAYFSIDPSFGLNGVSVYLQVIPYVLFGKSVVVTRMVSALVTLLGAILTGLLLKQVFKLESYWLGILLLITGPAWFLHARTAFEYIEVAAFFAALIYFYNLYRQGNDKYLYATVIAAALTFYTHGLGQVLVALTAALLFLSDFHYHLQPQRRKTILIAVGLAVLLFLPYLRYNLDHPSIMAAEIRQRGSYWMNNNLALKDKIAGFISEYLFGFNPFFWFFPNNTRDIPRHIMKGYGNILLPMLPFAILGIIKVIRNFNKSEYRSVLIALLVAPIPAAIVAIGTPRILWMMIPWVILIALGLDWSLHWLDKNTRFKKQISDLALFVLLSLISISMLTDALWNGPTWYQDYSLYGMQYGAKQLFQDTIIPELNKDQNISFMVSPSWANGTGELADFFIPQNLNSRMRFGTPNDLLNSPQKLTPNTIFILTPDEFTNFSNDEKFQNIQVRETIPYPNGKPGFYLVTLTFSDNIDQLMVEEHNKQRTPVEDTVTLNGQIIRMFHSPIGNGRIIDTFDDNPDTLTRVTEANPDIFDLYPDTPIATNNITIQTGSLPDFTVNISLYAPGTTKPITYSQTFQGLPPDPLVTIPFDKGPVKSSRIYVEIKDNTSGETSQIHVRTIQIK